MKRILIMSPIHRRPDLIVEQINNYWHFHGDRAVHLLHVSRDGKGNLIDLPHLLSGLPAKVEINPTSSYTSWCSVFGAFSANTEYVRNRLARDFSHVYLHTDGDLIVRGDICDWVRKNEIGYSSYSLNSSWVWYENAMADVRFDNLRKSVGISNESIFYGRQEGAFFPVDLWVEINDLIIKHYGRDFVMNSDIGWPIEECLIPTLAKHLRPGKSTVANVVSTKPIINFQANNPRDLDENCVQIEDIKSIIAKSGDFCAGIKWFSQDINHESRAFVRDISKPPWGDVG